MLQVSKAQAKRFVLMKNGLLGSKRFEGKEGLIAYFRQAGCVQRDSIDVCGLSHELSLLARVRGLNREMLSELLYKDHLLFEHFDKNLCLLLSEHWNGYAPIRSSFLHNVRNRELLARYGKETLALAHTRGGLSARDWDEWIHGENVSGRTVLEALWLCGEMLISGSKNGETLYACTSDCLPQTVLQSTPPFRNTQEYVLWQIVQRIGAVGLLWEYPSDAWLGINAITPKARIQALTALCQNGWITPLTVEKCKGTMFALSRDLPLLKQCEAPVLGEKRASVIPPLDALLWDRHLLLELFGFSYKWEYFTAQDQRQYGAYVLPVVYGEDIIGRIEPIVDHEKQTLIVRRFWAEKDHSFTTRAQWALEDALEELKRFLHLNCVEWMNEWFQE